MKTSIEKAYHNGKIVLSCGLKTFPKEIYNFADTLEFLDLSGNELEELPNDFSCLKHLKILFLSQNLFKEFPKVLYECKQLDIVGFKANQISTIDERAIPENLRWLILTNNQLRSLPKSIGNCTRLQKVMLAGNKLTSLPSEMSACKNLQLLRISANQFSDIPKWLFTMPKLSWLAFGSNPCSFVEEKIPKIREIPWSEVEIKEMIGSGASGNIYEAIFHSAESASRSVAIKLFKGEVTSDGLPIAEMEAAIFAGNHPNLIEVIGKISGHPNSNQGLVLELIPKIYTNLGLPPNYETCTRDRFSAGTQYSLNEVIQILLGIASVSEHLHTHKISHGDLYAHNILINRVTNKVLIGDFGAASRYGFLVESQTSIEKIEVRAFGCLMDDLIGLVEKSELDSKRYQSLTSLREECLQEKVLDRPCFQEINQRLETQWRKT